jgi:hypothetical protein
VASTSRVSTGLIPTPSHARARLARAARRCSMSYGGASPSAMRARPGKGKDEMAHEMSILPLSIGRTTDMPPRLSHLPFTLHHRRNVGWSLTSGPCTMQAHFSTTLARLEPVKEEFRGKTDGQDQSDHPNPTTQTTSSLRWPESQGFLVAIF